MGEGALAGMPLQLAGTRKILEYMDWGDDETLGTFVKLGAIGKYPKPNTFQRCIDKTMFNTRNTQIPLDFGVFWL